MKTLPKIHLFWILLLLASSCTVTNNLYVSDPVPAGKGEGDFYLGVGTGITPSFDSISENGDIYFSDVVSIAPNLLIGGRYGLGKQTDLRFALHFPYIIGGIGLRVGAQYSFFREWTKFNLALGADLGGVFAKDSMKFGDGGSVVFDPSTKGAINADFFLPVSYSFNENYRIILSPRISFNTVFIKYNQFEERSFKYTPFYPALSLSARLKKIYLEATVQYIDKMLLPGFGFVYTLGNDDETGE